MSMGVSDVRGWSIGLALPDYRRHQSTSSPTIVDQPCLRHGAEGPRRCPVALRHDEAELSPQVRLYFRQGAPRRRPFVTVQRQATLLQSRSVRSRLPGEGSALGPWRHQPSPEQVIHLGPPSRQASQFSLRKTPAGLCEPVATQLVVNLTLPS